MVSEREKVRKSEKSKKNEKKSPLDEKLIFGGDLENEQISAFPRFRIPKAPQKPYELLSFWLMWRKWMKVYEIL